MFINRNLVVLFSCQIIFVSGSVLLVTIGGVAGYELASDPALATLPVALMVVGTAFATIPAAYSMRVFGRRWGLALGTVIAACGAWLGTFALAQQSFSWFCAATALIGASLAFSQQFRFAAAESVPLEKVGYAISFILLGSICGAFAGPALVNFAVAYNPSSPYTFGFSAMIFAYLTAGVLLLTFKPTSLVESDHQTPLKKRPLAELLRSPLIVTAILAGVVGQGVMTYVMTATPISMTINEGFDLQQTSGVIRAHVIAMYLPSLVTPWLITRLGLLRVMSLGVLCMAITLGIGLTGQHLLHYWWALVLLGFGWNFLFVGGTTLLVQSYRPEERFQAQAVNDFSVFGASALASLLAGSILHALGWQYLLISVVPALLLMLVALVWANRKKSAEQTAN